MCCVQSLTTKLLIVNSKKILLYSLFVNSIFIFSCTVTTNKSIDPAFTMSLDSISKDINTIIFTPEANINGKQISSNGKTTTKMTINLINSNNLPADTSKQNVLGQYIATLLKNALKDRNEFTDYEVLFTRKSTNGSTTKSAYTGYSYKSSALKEYIQIVSLGDKFDSTTFQATGKTAFTENDPQIVAAFKYYNNIPGSAISFEIYKQTDSGMALLTKRDNGVIQAGNSYSVNVLKTADFYNIKELKSGTYKLQYLVSDTTAGEKYFKLL